MPRAASEVEAEIATKKAAGAHQASREMKELRAELAEARALADPHTNPDDIALVRSLELSPILASDDVAFVNEALAQLVLKGKGAKPEQCYSDVRSVLAVKHMLEDAAGLKPSGRISLPHWDTLGRDRDTGEKFKPGENQAIVDGLQQRAVPAPKGAPASSRPSITTRDGAPLRLPRTRLDEPEGNAEFVTESLGSAD